MVSGLVLLAADVISKVLTAGAGNSLLVHPMTNSRFMFGLGDGAASLGFGVLTGVVAVAMLVVGVRLWRAGALPSIGLGAVAAGLAGNLGDRVINGAVHDWLVIGNTSWNFADFYLAAGIPWLLILLARSGPASPRRSEPGSTFDREGR